MRTNKNVPFLGHPVNVLLTYLVTYLLTQCMQSLILCIRVEHLDDIILVSTKTQLLLLYLLLSVFWLLRSFLYLFGE